MKKVFGYGVIIVIGVLGIITMMFRCESIDSNVSRGNNTVEIFA